MNQSTQVEPIPRTESLRDSIKTVDIQSKLGWSYNPINYAWSVHRAYLERFGRDQKQSIFLGMNPGPWGMGQTGVPFGDPYIVRDWMGLGDDYTIKQPDNMSEERPVIGFESDRKEGSGQRLYGYLRDSFGDLENFFTDHFILNYCPLLMFTPEGKNLTPSDLLKADRERIYDRCDPYLSDMVQFYDPDVLVGVGKFATERLEDVFPDRANSITRIPHPSPASPIATRDGGQYWIDQVTEALERSNIIS